MSRTDDDERRTVGEPDGVDYRAVFDVSPTAAVLLSPDDLVIVDANAAYERAVGTTREHLLGQSLLDAFPADPGQGAAGEAAARVRESLERVRRTGLPDALPPLRYDLREPGTGQFAERYWTMLTVPVLGPDGTLQHLLHKLEDLTPFMAGSRGDLLPARDRPRRPGAVAPVPEEEELTADVLLRAHALREAFLRMRETAERERHLALVLQESLLTPPPQGGDLTIVVRYHAAAAGSAVGGDWYDAYLQPDGSTVLVVGDVTGHDVTAAAKMGQLRALLRAIGYDAGAGPAETLERADHTAAGLVLDTTATVLVAHVGRPGAGAAGAALGRLLRWSNAGHPPPAVLRADGTVELLSRTSEPLLGVVPDADRTDHSVAFEAGDTLLLYTDGLVERRGHDIDEGLERLVATLRGRHGDPLDELCEEVLTGLGARDHEDDVVLVAVRARPTPPG